MSFAPVVVDCQAFLRANHIQHFGPEVDMLLRMPLPPREEWGFLVPPLLVLEWARDRWGVPVVISSAYRTRAHNLAVGGAPASQHPQADGLDFHTGGALLPLTMARTLLEHPWAPWMGLGCYGGAGGDGHVHLDTRGLFGDTPAPARWGTPAQWWKP